MKKLIFAAILGMGFLTTTVAQTEVSKEELMAQTTLSTQDFIEVNVSDLPQPVSDAVAKDFEDATILKAWKNEKGEFKLAVKTADKQNLTLHSNAKGEWLTKQ